MASIKERLQRAFDSQHYEADDDIPSISNADLFIEREPTVAEFLQEITPSRQAVGRYVYNLFPFIQWIGKYNVTWLIGDLVAGMRNPSSERSDGNHRELTKSQASPSEPSSSPKVWPMPSLPSSASNSAFTRLSWAS